MAIVGGSGSTVSKLIDREGEPFERLTIFDEDWGFKKRARGVRLQGIHPYADD